MAEKLNERNFLEWSLSVKLFLKSQKNMGYLLGTIKDIDISGPYEN